jgi:hypothetical protein
VCTKYPTEPVPPNGVEVFVQEGEKVYFSFMLIKESESLQTFSLHANKRILKQAENDAQELLQEYSSAENISYCLPN